MKSRIYRNIEIILRSERLIARHRMDVAGRRTLMYGAAAIFGGMALIMLDVAAYLGLAEHMDPALAALIVAGGNVVLAGMFLALAANISAERDVQGICEVRDMAIADLEAEVNGAAEEIRELATNLRRFTKDPFSASGLGLLAPLLGMILKSLRK